MKLLPQPQKLCMQEGVFYTNYTSRIVIDSSCGANVFLYAQQLQETVKKWCGLEVAIVRGTGRTGDIVLKQQDVTANGQPCYELYVKEDGICIVGATEELLLNGVQTLRQMYAQSGSAVACLTVEDYPGLPNRGFYHDVTRGRVPKLDELKKLVDTMCYYKLNQLQLYVEHTYLFENISELWRDETPLTAEEIMELDDYCYARHIDLVPSLASFGHLYKLLSTETCKELCERENSTEDAFSFWARMAHHTVNVSNPDSIAWVKQMVEEYMGLFRSNYFNICADETFDLCKGRSKHLVENTNVKDIYTQYVTELSEFLMEKGKTPMYWGDILWDAPEKIQNLPKENICLNWGYLANQREDETRQVSEAGAIQYTCPGVAGWNEWINLFKNCYENITRMCSYAYKYGAIGVLNTDWGDFGHINQPEFSIPGMIYGAAFSWNQEQMSFEETNEAVSVLEYADPTGKLMETLCKANGLKVFNWYDVVKFYEASYLPELGEMTNRKDILCMYLEGGEEAVQTLREVRKEFQMSFRAVDSSKKYMLQKYMVALDAMVIWTRICPLVAKAVYDIGEPKESGVQLAAELETWFYYYKQEWRKVSREGDLARISEVVFWYADMLRKMK